MLKSSNALIGYKIQATDGQLGKVHDFYFDDKAWRVRYLVADTGNWLPGRKVLIAPEALHKPNWAESIFPVALSKGEIKESPSIDYDQPVSLQHELALSEYYNWDPYWKDVAGIAYTQTNIYNPIRPAISTPKAKTAENTPPGKAEELKKKDADPHLRSMREVTNYDIRATDGNIGHVEGFIVDDETWHIRYLVIDTRNWLPGKKVLISPAWIADVDWNASEVAVDLNQATIKSCPEYDPEQPVNRTYETMLYDYYGRPYYWKESGEPEPVR
mgnify:CR=1 FL=1